MYITSGQLKKSTDFGMKCVMLI